ncbi:uncharacterized protein NECHADRAFT_81605 [Fusarium vanettenii 77-13-4]|uniref:Uncharacterized protein n=1 Tax=Fusarium vanettenii (strain ATCC MYA-4622 / CBS 123669 / FGSC 9596 / NRRL 45880 / 77-13-4) TaxID=660122 RepID=C7Z998_FUSV7|nr:uncharacterized protein NECHADRAFT_81605 [Fusarium vanettenii 77-13-4]EEU39433.1 predicted protein [Fusarium vanettenii 77-13-4]
MAPLLKSMLLLSALSIVTAEQIKSTQPLRGEAYVGRPAVRHAMRQKTRYEPGSLSVHRDSGNTRSEDFEAPLGVNPKVEAIKMAPPFNMFWDEEGRVLAANQCRENTTCIVSLDPDTYEIEATYPEPDQPSDLSQTLMVYMQLLDGHVTTSTANRHILELEIVGKGAKTTFVTKRDIDLSNVTSANELILSTSYDSDGNLWFTTGGFAGAGFPAGDTATLGYVEPGGKVHTLKLPDKMIENSFAISGTDVYLLTGPAGSADHADASGSFLYMQPSPEGVKVIAELLYEAGDGIKKGSISRGAGSTPSLLGHKYVAFTDNANDQVNVIVYPQGSALTNNTKPLCTVPLFEKGSSSNENAGVNHWDGKSTYSMVFSNFYNGPPLAQLRDAPFGDGTDSDPEILNGPFNDLSAVGPGLTRVDFDERTGKCTTRWYNKSIRTTITPIMSTKTGLLYMPTQDYKLAQKGSYVYYVSALDFETGKEVWKVRTGAGGVFSNHFQTPVLTKDGGVGHYVIGGFVKVKDGKKPKGTGH